MDLVKGFEEVALVFVDVVLVAGIGYVDEVVWDFFVADGVFGQVFAGS